MYNFEKYKDLILSLDERFAVSIHTNELEPCPELGCAHCLFRTTPSCRVARIRWLYNEYIEPPVDWTKVKPDTPILVRIDCSGAWEKRHFAKYEFGQVHYWIAGKTSWTTNQTCWRLPDGVRLAE